MLKLSDNFNKAIKINTSNIQGTSGDVKGTANAFVSDDATLKSIEKITTITDQEYSLKTLELGGFKITDDFLKTVFLFVPCMFPVLLQET